MFTYLFIYFFFIFLIWAFRPMKKGRGSKQNRSGGSLMIILGLVSNGFYLSRCL
jgi:hypothetical protein